MAVGERSVKDAKTVVLSDLDSTIADTEHRHHLLPAVNPDSDWERYSLACTGDIPIQGTVAALRLHNAHHQIRIVSGRAEAAQEITYRWLNRHLIPCQALKLYRYAPEEVRELNDGLTINARHKISYIRWLRACGMEVVLMYEDSALVAGHIERETGVPVVLVSTASSHGELRKYRV
jgi:hypothetical protein